MSIADSDSVEAPVDLKQESAQPADAGLSEKGIRAMQGQTPERINSGLKGSEFEAKKSDYLGDGVHRITVRPEDNAHLTDYGDGLGLVKRRTSDGYIDKRGEIWEQKSGYEKGGINKDQIHDYMTMEDAGYVNIRDAGGNIVKTPVTSVNYLFDSKAGADANAADLGGLTTWYVDKDGHVQLHGANDE